MLGDDVDEETLLQSSELEVNGERFQICIYIGSGGRFFAKSCLGEDDFIITDGQSLMEAFNKHEALLPLAVASRKLTQSYLGSPRGSWSRHPEE
jgi:hypothetical protein